MNKNSEKAKSLLAEAGWKDRDGDGILENEKGDKFTFEYTYATGGEISERIARFVKDSFGKAGIIMTTRPVDWSRYQELLKLRDFDAITMGWGNNAPESDPRQIWHSESIKEGGDNFTQWNSPQCDALIEQGRRAGVAVLVGPKGRDFTKYSGATAITPNRGELAAAIA